MCVLLMARTCSLETSIKATSFSERLLFYNGQLARLKKKTLEIPQINRIPKYYKSAFYAHLAMRPEIEAISPYD